MLKMFTPACFPWTRGAQLLFTGAHWLPCSPTISHCFPVALLMSPTKEWKKKKSCCQQLCGFLEYMLWRLKKKKTDEGKSTLLSPQSHYRPRLNSQHSSRWSSFTHMHLHFNTPLCAVTETIHHGWGWGAGGVDQTFGEWKRCCLRLQLEHTSPATFSSMQ